MTLRDRSSTRRGVLMVLALSLSLAIGWGLVVYGIGELAWGNEVPDWLIVPSGLIGFVIGAAGFLWGAMKWLP